ncbi:DotI/IcmL/TraM family protein [Desulfovibrio sp. ZJ369]|uniref:DotI/IcmL/TraM family protein n=1 Tax=Desulfovibrio sp. ZJ369 TaxID=2709793 RepID=UPI0013EDDCF1|nr:DotI/IcmL/TraM family protein [Desulfovibrio sp. ZJ369]
MSIFNKRKDAPKPQEPEQGMNAIHAEPPAPDAAAVIGGLDWYRTQFRRSMKLSLCLVAALCLSVSLSALLLLNQPKPRYFAATPDLRLAPMVPLDQPLLTQEGLLTWVSSAITGAMSLNFLEWREKLESIRPHFEDEAFKSFLASLQGSGILDMIRDKRLSASAVATRAPVIIASGLVGGRATWKIEFPLIVSYESSQGVESTQKLLATVLVRRASTAKTPRGVVIQQVVLKRDS